MRITTLVLPNERPMGLNRLLSRVSWPIRNEEVARVKLAVRAALDPNWPMFESAVTITVIVYFKNKGMQLDASNIPAKLYEDGLIDWLIEDDSPQYVRAMRTVSLLDRDNPRVEIEIKEIEDG